MIHKEQINKIVWLNKQYFFLICSLLSVFLNNGKWTSKNQILNILAVIILFITKGYLIFYFCARIDLRYRSEGEAMSLSHTKAQKWWLKTDCVQMSEVPLTDNPDTSFLEPPDWSVNSIIDCAWSVKACSGHFTIMGPITVQWLYSVTVWAQSLYPADVFLSVATFLRRPQFVMIVTCPDKELRLQLLMSSELVPSPDAWSACLYLADCLWASQRDGAGANPDPADSCVLPPGGKIIDLNSVPFLPSSGYFLRHVFWWTTNFYNKIWS